MAEKKTGKKFVQKPKFRNEKKYKTDKTEVKKYNTFGKKKAEKKIVVKSEKGCGYVEKTKVCDRCILSIPLLLLCGYGYFAVSNDSWKETGFDRCGNRSDE